ncbi:glycine oxidase [Thalassoporum mexicanum PCC 7367]|uniref:glycine oxidase ThiO n=1 Tax=Thalassoporum mexicanum TaxID=3457544 RepID=UPI00029FE0C7|nr:glycine oxidase ThiO [Pseudanabaena sp. PCC 7367]AFY71398.1 glycine oxidase [Pseudanabaena sp. PCC 7367]
MTDVLIIGGGIIGLSIAIDLALYGAKVTVVDRQRCGHGATWAAAGMLAPEAEQLSGKLAQLGRSSRDLYPYWINKLEDLTGQDCGYWQSGIFTPITQKEQFSQYPAQCINQFVNKSALARIQEGLSKEVLGGLWFEDDAQVDSRRLLQVLIMAARSLSVNLLEGVSVYDIVAHADGNRISHLETSSGKFQAGHYLVATGAWTRELMPLPVSPHKGQMLSVFDPDRSLHRVIFAPGIYIVPRLDGTIILGATVEQVGFAPGNTAIGIQTLLTNAIALYPAIANMTIQETWWGFRPYAPKEMPLLGASNYENLSLATGHYRNGILLAPITAKLLTEHIRGGNPDPILKEFSYSQ